MGISEEELEAHVGNRRPGLPRFHTVRHSSCIAVGPQKEHSFHISTRIGLNSYYYLTRRTSELLRCCLGKSVLETSARWEADMSSQRMSHTRRMRHSSPLCNILLTKAVVFVIDSCCTEDFSCAKVSKDPFLSLISMLEGSTN